MPCRRLCLGGDGIPIRQGRLVPWRRSEGDGRILASYGQRTLQDPRVRNVPFSPTVSVLFCPGLPQSSTDGHKKYLISLDSNGAAGVD